MAVFEPVGIYHCAQTYRYETPRQGVFARNSGVITFQSGMNFEEALRDLEGFDRIWILFEFHLNATWRPKVRPPVAPDNRKIGVFATRSPHRPNRIGMSCVELEKVDGLNVYVRNSDLLDRTPVLDIKPYIPRADSFPDAHTGWLEQAQADLWNVEFTPSVLADMQSIFQISGLDLESFCKVQLSMSPLSPERKRLSELDNGRHAIGCRTWQIVFSTDESSKTVHVEDVLSHYTEEEIAPGAPDKYGDKEFHRIFRKMKKQSRCER